MLCRFEGEGGIGGIGFCRDGDGMLGEESWGGAAERGEAAVQGWSLEQTCLLIRGGSGNRSSCRERRQKLKAGCGSKGMAIFRKRGSLGVVIRRTGHERVYRPHW